MYIIKPDAFWEKRRSGTGLKKEQSSVIFEVSMIHSVGVERNGLVIKM